MSDFDPAIYNEQYENAFVEGEDFAPIVVKNIITRDQANYMLAWENSPNASTIFQNFAGHKAVTFQDPGTEEFLNKIMTDIIGEKMILKEYSCARYSNDYGYKPKLFPHFDTHYQGGQRITLDIQLRANIHWAVFVEGKPFFLNDLDALIFSGTQQIHWRQNKTLLDNQEVIMLFAHFEYENNRPWVPNQKEILEYRSHRMREKVGISNQPEPLKID